ncbi:MAG: hypothetical protein NVSMB4_19640 [Acidimicrobiales bacterium]
MSPDSAGVSPDSGGTTQGELTIDELAAASRVPSRTIRLYQTKGVLDPPERRGRKAFYGPAHLERLRLIGELQDRGLQLSAIKELLRDGTGDVREWLGLGETLAQPFADDHPKVFAADDVAALLDGRRSGTLAELVRAGLLDRQGDRYVAPSPGLLQTALALQEAGVDIATSSGAAAIIRKRLAQASAELVDYLSARVGDGFGRDSGADSIAAAFDGVRTSGGEATRLIFADEVEKAVAKLVAGGGLIARRPAVRG